jgi:NitT/TauT family transport system ATP-binding protein
MRPEWAENQQETIGRLLTALDAAARWCDLAENHDDLSRALADARYIGAPESIIRHVLAGEFSIDSQGNRRVIDKYFLFHGGHANYPRQSQALWIYSQMIRWGQAKFSQAGVEAALSAYRPDIYRTALGDANAPDDADIRIEGQDVGDRFVDGFVFDPADIAGYVDGFTVRTSAPFPPASGEV